MGNPFLRTQRLALEFESTETVLAHITAMSVADRAEMSPEWLARLRTSPMPSPWTHGFTLVERATGAVVGACGYKGPPDADGIVEIAYGLAPAYQKHGYAREAASALACAPTRGVRARARGVRLRAARGRARPGGRACAPVGVPDRGADVCIAAAQRDVKSDGDAGIPRSSA